ncbi:MAG: 1-deoxy-D-xylulose-5-phosphate reductoisomerase [Acidimicrobiales bacterium]
MGVRTVSLVGSTGSIGVQALQVVAAQPERFRVVALCAHRSVAALAEQAERVHPDLVVIGEPSRAAELAARVGPGVQVMAGVEGLRAAATAADVVVNGVVGFAGLPVTLAALEAGCRLALANKESLIAGAPIVQRARKTAGAQLLPVDSEHCAIHQCLASSSSSDLPEGDGTEGDGTEGDGTAADGTAADGTEGDGTAADAAMVARLLVTASGGPFRGRTRESLTSVSVDDALAHPTWRMGPKITIDSSTLMNKGLEVIEAHELFGIPYERIEVVVHPQSVVHSMVEFVDGATLAQLSNPDMRLPIGYAMGWPERITTAYGRMDWTSSCSLTFEPPDRSVFVSLDLAYRAGSAGGPFPAWLNAANEVAVGAFLDRRISWLAIPDVVDAVLEKCPGDPLTSLDDVLDADRQARRHAEVCVQSRMEAA